MNKEVTLTFGNQILEITGYYSGADRNTNKPPEFELATIYYNSINILPLLEAIPSGFDVLEELQEECIKRIR